MASIISQRFRNTSISRALTSKLEKARQKIKEDNEIYINKDHQKLCYHYSKYLEFKKKVKMEKKKLEFSYIDDGITRHLQVEVLNQYSNNPSFNIELYTKKEKFTHELEYNQFNHKFVNQVQKIINVDQLQDFFDKQSEFIKNLSIRDRYNLKYYTNQGDTIMVHFINRTFDITNIEFPRNNIIFYFQFLDYFNENPVYNSFQVNTSDYYQFSSFIMKNYKSFNHDIYNYVINKFIQELKDLYEKAPRTKEVMYVYRGINDNYIAQEVSKNKSLGYFISNRFTSTSIFATTAFKFTNTQKLYEIKIEKGLPVIFMEGITLFKGEYEVLLPINATFFIDYANKIIKHNNMNKSFICIENEQTDNINITSLVYIG